MASLANDTHSMHNCAITVPTSYEFLRSVSTDSISLALLIIGVTFAFFVFLLFGFHLFYIATYVRSPACVGRLLWLAALFPVSAVACTTVGLIPRAVGMADVLIMLFIAAAMFRFVALTISFFGGRLKMYAKLENVSVKPCCGGRLCCCCVCCPTIRATKRNIIIMEMLVYQVAIVRPILYFVEGVVFVDDLGSASYDETTAPRNRTATVTTILNLISTMTAMLGARFFALVSKEALKAYHVKEMFGLLKVMIFLFNLQGSFFTVLVSTHVIRCTPLLPALAQAMMWHHLLLLLETFVLSLTATIGFRASSNAAFDLYHPAAVHSGGEDAAAAQMLAGQGGVDGREVQEKDALQVTVL